MRSSGGTNLELSVVAFTKIHYCLLCGALIQQRVGRRGRLREIGGCFNPLMGAIWGTVSCKLLRRCIEQGYL
jgi:hypothetical protein